MTRRLLLVLALAVTAGCQYESRIVREEPLPDELVAFDGPHELPDTRQTVVSASLSERRGVDSLTIEEVTTAQFRTERTFVTQWREVRRAEVRSRMAAGEFGAFWIFPHSFSFIDNFIDEDSGPVATTFEAVGGGLAYVVLLPFYTWVLLVSDVVWMPVHIPVMFFDSLDKTATGEPEERPLVDRRVVERISHTERADDVRLHLGPDVALLPERDADGRILLDSTELLALDRPPAAALEVTYLLDDERRRVHVDVPAKWIEGKREAAGFVGEAVVQRLPPRARVTPALPDAVRAGHPTPLRIDVENIGKGAFQRLVATTVSDDPYLNGRNLHFGDVAAGRTASAEATLHLPRTHAGGSLPLRLVFREANGRRPAPVEMELDIARLARPKLLSTYRLVDDGSGQSVGNGDGRIQRREAVELALRVVNEGSAPAKDAVVHLDGDQRGIQVIESRAALGDLGPGEEAVANLSFEVMPDFAADAIGLTVTLAERSFREDSVLDLELPLDDKVAQRPAVLDRTVWSAGAQSSIREGAGDASRVLFDVGPGVELQATGLLGGYYRVEFDVDDRRETGWIARADVSRDPPDTGRPATGSGGTVVIVERQNMPPLLSVSSPSDDLRTTEERLPFVAEAADDTGLTDWGVRLNGTEVELSTRDLGNVEETDATVAVVDPGAGDGRRSVLFRGTLELQAGMNEVLFFAVDQGGERTERRFTVELVRQTSEVFLAAIGINSYSDARIPPLAYAEDDALAVFDALKRGLGVRSENAWNLIGPEASRFGILDLLTNRMRREVGPEDTVIVYFAGHGATEPDNTKPDGLAKYFVPQDAIKESLPATGIPTEALAQHLERIPAERLVFLADACFSGGQGRSFTDAAGFRSGLSDEVYDEIVTRSGRVFLGACAAQEVAGERDGHGIFTAALLDALRGHADVDGDRLVTVSEAYEYVASTVRRETGGQQNPALAGTFEGSPILADLRRR